MNVNMNVQCIYVQAPPNSLSFFCVYLVLQADDSNKLLKEDDHVPILSANIVQVLLVILVIAVLSSLELVPVIILPYSNCASLQ